MEEKDTVTDCRIDPDKVFREDVLMRYRLAPVVLGSRINSKYHHGYFVVFLSGEFP